MRDLWAEFRTFAAAQMNNRDIDPLYPVLAKVESDLDSRLALWYSLLYVTYYNIASSDVVWQQVPLPGPIPDSLARLPTGTERRGLRGGKVQQHVESLLDVTAADPYGWLHSRIGYDPWYNWDRIFADLQTIWGNGRWAAYKTCEILQKVHGWPLLASDMGNAWSSGPRKGLALFFGEVKGNDPGAVMVLDRQAAQIQRALWKVGIPLSVEELETILCDFHSVQRGHYYPGHDIDEMETVMRKAGSRKQLWEARKAALPNEWLKELDVA